MIQNYDEIASFHDCVYEATNVSYDNEQLKEIFLSLPDEITMTAEQWGLSDTVFRDAVYTHLKEK